MKKAVFVLGTMDYKAVKKGEAFLESTLDLLDSVATKAGVDAELIFCMQDPLTAGKSKGKPRVKQKDIMAERPRVLSEISHAKPDFVMCFGPVATACVFGKGNVSEGEALRQAHYPLGEDQPPVFVTFGMANVRYKAGLAPWLALDVQSAAHGYRETEWGDYLVLLPGTPEWDSCPPELAALDAVGWDYETYPGLNPWEEDARIRMVVLSDRVGRAWIVQAKPDSSLPQWVYDIQENPDVVKAGSNPKFDFKWAARFGRRVVNIWDTSTAEHVIDSTNPKKDLKSLTFRYVPKLGDYSKAHRDLVRKRKTKEHDGWRYVRDDEQYQYCGGDGEASIGAYEGQVPIIKKKGLQRPMKLMLDLYPVLARMEAVGSAVSLDENRRLDELYQEKLATLREDVVVDLGPINLNSHQQLGKALKELIPGINLSLRDWVRAVGDEEDEESSTKRTILERESHKHPVIAKVLEYRKYRTRHSTFIKGVYEKHLVQHDGRYFIHPTYRSDVVETYRLSSQAPNDQNFPRKDNDDPVLTVKKQFISRFDGGVIMDADQSQVEIRFAAMISGDVKMLEAINSGEDIHYAMAAIMLDKLVPPAGEEETCDPKLFVTELERQECKARTFLILYGGGAKKLAADLKVSRRRAQRMIDEYFATFSGLRKYIDKVHADVRRDLYVETVWGFRRHFVKPDQWDSSDGWSVMRQAFNTMVQNGAVGVTYCSMIWLDRALREEGLKSVLFKQVHDSMVVDVYPGEEERVAELLRYSMGNAAEIAKEYGVNITVPLHCDVVVGQNWGEVEKLPQAA